MHISYMSWKETNGFIGPSHYRKKKKKASFSPHIFERFSCIPLNIYILIKVIISIISHILNARVPELTLL